MHSTILHVFWVRSKGGESLDTSSRVTILITNHFQSYNDIAFVIHAEGWTKITARTFSSPFFLVEIPEIIHLFWSKSEEPWLLDSVCGSMSGSCATFHYAAFTHTESSCKFYSASNTIGTYFFQFLSCWCLCRFFATDDTTFLMWIILKDFHCLVWFLRRVLFPMNGMTTNLRNLNRDDVGAGNRHSYAASYKYFCWFSTAHAQAQHQPLTLIRTYKRTQIYFSSLFTAC